MIRSRLSPLLDDAVLQLERLLPPARRGLVQMSLDQAETAKIEDLPAAARVSVLVPADRALLRAIGLPVGTDIRRAISLWLEDASPWAQGTYLWDAAQGADPAQWQVAILPRSPVTELEDRLERRGSTVAEIRLAAADGTLFTLRPDETGRSRLRRGLLAFVGFVTAFGLGLMIWQGQSALAARALAAASLAEGAALLEDGANGAATATALALRTEKARIPALAARLGFLAEHVPKDTWLLHLGLEGPRFTLSGRSTLPEAIIPSLTKPDAGLSTRNVDFDGPMARDIQSGLFSFAVTGEFTGAGEGK